MFITNSKVFTTRDQNDLETLKKFAENLFEQFNQQNGTEHNPEDFFEEREAYSCYKVPEGMKLNFLLDNGCDYVALEEDDMIERPGRELITYKYKFNQEETSTNSDQLARYVIEQKSIEAELKEVKSAYKARMDEKSAQITKYSNWVANGYDMRDEECRVLVNYKEKKKQYITVRTNTVVREEELTTEDYQFFISFPPLGATA